MMRRVVYAFLVMTCVTSAPIEDLDLKLLTKSLIQEVKQLKETLQETTSSVEQLENESR